MLLYKNGDICICDNPRSSGIMGDEPEELSAKKKPSLFKQVIPNKPVHYNIFFLNLLFFANINLRMIIHRKVEIQDLLNLVESTMNIISIKIISLSTSNSFLLILNCKT